MKIGISSIGKLKAGPERELFDRYMKRSLSAGPQLGFSSFAVREFVESRASSADQRKQQEAELILSSAQKGAAICALDENGKDFTSEQFANLLASSRDQGISQFVFALGGPDGHGSNLLQTANPVIRFGKMTWPHQVARILLAEQIYRALTILNGHPYHRR